jgi:starvation-inducible DNA-binding protein
MTNSAEIKIGISPDDRKSISGELSKVLAETYSLYLKTQNFHWNVTGPLFSSLHLLFEGQYTAMIPAVDELAERIRALGFQAPASFEAFGEISSIKGGNGDEKDLDMVRLLVEGNESVAKVCRKALKVADEAHDNPTVDLLTRRLNVHEKNAWMLRSLLEKN